MKIIRADGRTITIPDITPAERDSLDHQLLVQAGEMERRGTARFIPIEQQMAATSARLERERQAESGQQPGPGWTEDRACVQCGKEFRSQSSRHRFCSVSCAGAWKKADERIPAREGVVAR